MSPSQKALTKEPGPLLLRACRRQPVDRTPVWFMRQAGRYMPEYQMIRKRYSLLEICQEPDLITQVTLQPVEALGVDGAILFADILLPLVAMGIDLDYVKGEGPVIHNPVRSAEDVRHLQPVDPEEALAPIMQALAILRDELPRKVALLGFAGAPFTVASYLIEGGASRHFVKTKRLMRGHPDAWQQLMNRLTRVTSDYLLAQIRAGAQVVQLFDSWVGALGPADYEQFVLPYTSRVLQAVAASGAASIHFGTGTAGLLRLMARAGGDVIGLDWRVDLGEAWSALDYRVAIQGNLDPTALLAPSDSLRDEVARILRSADGRPGHIFNLGHGVLPETPVDHVKAVVELVHEFAIREPE
jgi:uroporphyrinogen decarboxylase